MVKFNPSQAHANIEPVWRGASYKQPPTAGGRYFDREGNEVNVGGMPATNAPPKAAPKGKAAVVEPDEVTIDPQGWLVWGGRRWIREDHYEAYMQATAAAGGIPLDGGTRTFNIGGDPPNPVRTEFPTLMEIVGDPEMVKKLQAVGIVDVPTLAGLDDDMIATLPDTIQFKRDWVKSAIVELAKIPGVVQHTADPEPKVKSGIALADLVAWAKRENTEPYHWQTIRKAFLEHCNAAVTGEGHAVAMLVKDGHLKEEEAKR